MRQMLRMMGQYLRAGEDLVLVSITASSGATPRGAGARMLVGRSGRLWGTIGGGAVEYHAQQRAMEILEKKVSERQDYSLTRDDVQNLGMICGGTVEVFFHYIPAGDENTAELAALAEERFARHEAMWLISRISGGGELSLYTAADGFMGSPCPEWLEQRLTSRASIARQGEEQFSVEQIASSGRVYIFGCGHVSMELEPLLTRVGFRCVVLADRPEFADRKLFPTAEEVHLVDFTRILDTVSVGPEDYVCVMTRGHAYDTLVQAQVLPCRPRYVGVIGSRKKAAAVRAALRDRYGLSEEELRLVTTPIGLDIGAETPAEIAVSVAAQMIAVRAAE